MNNLSIENAHKITLHFLCKEYGIDVGSQLYAEYQDKLFDYHGLAWSLGQKNLKYFCNIFLYNLLFDYSGDNVPLSQTHYNIWLELQDVILNRSNTKHCYVLPRSFGKSTTITISLAIWCALYCHHPFIVIDSATEKQAENFINSIKLQIEDNGYIKSCFGEVVNRELKYNASEIELDIKPCRSKIQCVSSTSSVRGINYGSHRIGLLLMDDAQDEKQITSDSACMDLVSRINNGILKALQNKKNNVIALGTVQRKGDLYDTFCHSPIWVSRMEKCIQLDDIDDYFNNSDGWQHIKRILQNKAKNPNALYDAENYYIEHQEELQFPLIWDNYDCFNLALEYFDDPVSFKQERQCDINSLGEKRITSLSAMPKDQIERQEFTNTILSVDPAATKNKKSDYSAFCVMSDTDLHIKYARKCIIKRLEFDDYINLIIALLKAYPDISIISIEKQVYMGADLLKLKEKISTIPELMSRPFTYINKSRTKNKDARIDTIIPDINMSRIIFNDEDIEAIAQIKKFCGCAFTDHDDMIDSVADAVENLSDVKERVPMLQVYDLSKFGF